MTFFIPAVLLVIAVALLYRRRGYWAWVAPGAFALIAWGMGGVRSAVGFGVVAGLFGGLALVLGVRPLRRRLVSSWVMRLIAPKESHR